MSRDATRPGTCGHCHRPPVAGCDGRGTVEYGACAFGACPNDLELRTRVHELKRTRDPVAWNWIDGRGRVATKHAVFGLVSQHAEKPWVLVLDGDGDLRVVDKKRVESLEVVG